MTGAGGLSDDRWSNDVLGLSCRCDPSCSSKKTKGSNMNAETKSAETKPARTKPPPADLWEQTKAWADKNRTISGALLGGAAGTIVPGIGTVIGTIAGAGIGFASSMEKKDDRAS